MRQFTPNYKIQSNSLIEIRRGLVRACESLADAGVRYEGQALRPGTLVNAYVLRGLKTAGIGNEAEARAVLADLRAIQESDEPVPIVPLVQPPAKPSKSRGRFAGTDAGPLLPELGRDNANRPGENNDVPPKRRRKPARD